MPAVVPIYNPCYKLIGPGFGAPWPHSVDSVPAEPQESADGHTLDTGRSYAYRKVTPHNIPAFGQVNTVGCFFQNFYCRTSSWTPDLAHLYHSGAFFPELKVDTGSPYNEGGSQFTVRWRPGEVLPHGTGTTTETSSFTMSAARAYSPGEQYLPDAAPFNPYRADRDVEFTASASLEVKNSVGAHLSTAFYASVTIGIYGNGVLRWPDTTLSTRRFSYIPYTIDIHWSVTDSSGYAPTGGWSSLFVLPPAAPFVKDTSGSVVQACFRTNKLAYNSTGFFDDIFDAYPWAKWDPTVPGAILPLSGFEPSSYTGDYAVLFTPGTVNGYFPFICPVTNLPIFDETTGRRTDPGLMPMTLRP